MSVVTDWTGATGQWASALASTAAVVAALWIANSENRRRRIQDARTFLAARMVMPAALSELTDYASECVSFLTEFNANEHGAIGFVPASSVPQIPAEAFVTLRQCVEFGDLSVAQIIADLISTIQIQRSRLTMMIRWVPLPGKVVVQDNIDSCMVDALEVHARAAKLFPYARRTTDAAPATPTIDDVRGSATNCDVHEDRPRVLERLARWTPILQRLSATPPLSPT